jgi:maleate isomerase
MTNTLGYRKVFAVLAPSTNTAVEADFARMRVPGVTSHMGRIMINDQDLSSNDAFEALLEQVREGIEDACRRVLTCEPDYMVMGMSAETFWGGIEGNKKFHEHMTAVSGLEMTAGAGACVEALQKHGVTRIAVITPYQAIGDDNVIQFFRESGFEITGIEGLRCESAIAISQVSEDRLRDAIHTLNTPETEAIVQVGTNLSMVSLADEAERWIGKPVIAINAATWWHALRHNGIDDQILGCGSLLARF